MTDKGYYQWRPHPWHGLEAGPAPPEQIYAYIEITPFDSIKYEVDKISGCLKVDRPQQSSSLPPELYGFIPRTFCGPQVCRLCEKARKGDEDPLDVCVIAERALNRSEVILQARVIGGIQTLDEGRVDDKIIAVLEQDALWGKVRDISELPAIFVDRLRHYFRTYKNIPESERTVTIEEIYGRDHGLAVVEASMRDYQAQFS